MGFRNILLMATGVGLYFAGQSIGKIGDAAPLVVGSVSPERLYYHLLGLALTVGALVTFIAAGVSFFKNFRK